MKQLSKISLAVVIGAALATAAAAQSRPNHNAPAPQRQAPQRQVTRTQTVRVNAPVERSFSFGNQAYRPLQNTQTRVTVQHSANNGSQNGGYTLRNHPVDTGMNINRGQGFGNGNENRGSRTGQGSRNNDSGWNSRNNSGSHNGNDSGWNNRSSSGSNNGNDSWNSRSNSGWNGHSNSRSNDGWNSHSNDGWNRQDSGDRNRGGDGGHVQHWQGDSRDWRDGYERRDNDAPRFSFNLYLNSPTQDCVASPWYYYPTVPAYLPLATVRVESPAFVNWEEGNIYYGSSNYALDNAVNEINSVFQSGNGSDAALLIQPYTNVNVYNDGQYEYSLNGNDFARTMQDDAENTQTVSFQVTSVRTDGAYAIIDAAHTFADPEGNTQTVYQEYRLQNMGGSYYIVDFSTSENPIG